MPGATRIVIAASATLAMSPLAFAQDPARGRAVAVQRCVSCHDINGRSRQPLRGATPFRDIALEPQFGPNWLAIYLPFSHPDIDGPSLGLAEVSELAAYIATLQRR